MTRPESDLRLRGASRGDRFDTPYLARVDTRRLAPGTTGVEVARETCGADAAPMSEVEKLLAACGVPENSFRFGGPSRGYTWTFAEPVTPAGGHRDVDSRGVSFRGEPVRGLTRPARE